MDFNKKKTRETIGSALLNKLPPSNEVAQVKSNRPGPETLITDSEEDYEFSRENIKYLLSTSNDAIATMLELARDSEHPRAFEVLANMLKSAADINGQLFDLQKARKKILDDGDSSTQDNGSGTTNNILFTGTTNDLQDFLTKRDEATTVDVP